MGLLVSEWWDIGKAVTLGTLVLAGLALVLRLRAVDRGFLAVFFLVHWDTLAWSSILNLKECMVLLLLVAATYHFLCIAGTRRCSPV